MKSDVFICSGHLNSNPRIVDPFKTDPLFSAVRYHFRVPDWTRNDMDVRTENVLALLWIPFFVPGIT